MNKSGLLLRLAISISFAAVFVGFISSQVFFKLAYQHNQDKTQENIEQLYDVVAPTANIAAYLGDQELAREVINGLKNSQSIIAASFESELFSLHSDNFLAEHEKQTEFIVTSPFSSSEKLGKVIVQHNLAYIEKDSKDAASFLSNSLLVQAFVVTIISIFIAFYFITKPILIIARSLHSLNPGTARRLKKPTFHDKSELGNLVEDINLLLEKAEEQLSQERMLRSEIEVLEKRFRLLFENSVAPIILMEPRGNILLTNKAFKSLLERIEQPIKKNYGPILSELFETPELLTRSVNSAFLNDEIAIGEHRLKFKEEDKTIWLQVVVSSIVTDDLKSYYQITLNDVSKKRDELDKLSRRADYDALTNMTNRHAAEKKIDQFIKEKTPFIFVLMDLNGFKQVNDIYGHDAGDEVLIFVANQLKQLTPSESIACRWGGDEFVLVLKDMSKRDFEALAEQLTTRIVKPYTLITHQANVRVGLCMGAAIYPYDSSHKPELIHLADKAMYAIKPESKQKGGRTLAFASPIESKEHKYD
jgi:diguanylate cyclase (GGDEF)-like protein